MTQDMRDVKVEDLSGAALDWAVARAEVIEVGIICPAIINENNRPALLLNKLKWLAGLDTARLWEPSTNWAQIGPLMQRHLVEFTIEHRHTICAGLCDENGMMVGGYQYGDTHLVAACRAIVAHEFGDTVQVPAALLEVA